MIRKKYKRLSKRKMFFVTVFVILLFFIVLAGLLRYGSYVTVSGEVLYDGFQKGSIEVYWTKRLNHGPPDIEYPWAVINLPGPGAYILKVPRNYRNIYICARNRGSMHESFAYFISDPIEIGTKDIRGYNIILRQNKLLMDDYNGKTIELSGKVSCHNCKEGKINVCIYSHDWFEKVRLPPDIARVSLIRPGEFRLAVPANIAGVYIMAVNIPEGERGGNSLECLRADFKDNPLIIKDKDINGITINID